MHLCLWADRCWEDIHHDGNKCECKNAKIFYAGIASVLGPVSGHLPRVEWVPQQAFWREPTSRGGGNNSPPPVTHQTDSQWKTTILTFASDAVEIA